MLAAAMVSMSEVAFGADMKRFDMPNASVGAVSQTLTDLGSMLSETASTEVEKIKVVVHNHRRYKAGKRKGKTPMEILTGKDQQEDWIVLLLDHVEKNDPSFFSRH